MLASKNLTAVARRSRVIELPDGKHVELKALTLADWATIEEEAVQAHRRAHIQTWLRNADLLQRDPGELEKVEATDGHELQRLKQRVNKLIADCNYNDLIGRAIGECNGITVDTMPPHAIPAWLDTQRGRLTIVWLSMRGADQSLTFDDVSALLSEHSQLIQSIAEAAAEISIGKLGRDKSKNESAPQPAGQHPTSEVTTTQTP